MAQIEHILQEEDNISDLSVQPSFTLSDILKEPLDEDVEPFQNIEDADEDWDAYFEDDQGEEQTPDQPFSASNIEQAYNAKVEGSQSSSKLQKTEPQILRRWSRLRDLPLPPKEEIKNMKYAALRNVSQLFDISESKGVGIPTCISATGSRFLALGTSLGNTVVFEVQVKGHRQLNTEDQHKFGQVTSVSVSRDNRYLVAGHDSGLITVWDLYSFKVIKKELLHKQRILKTLFCDNYENFVTSDAEGNIYMFTIENYLWVSVKHQLLIEKSNTLYHDIKYSKLKSGRQLLTLCSLESVLLIILKPNIGILGAIKRPEGISIDKVPHCEIGGASFKGREDGEDFVCVSWGKNIYVYRIIENNHNMGEVSLYFTIEHPSSIENLQLISNGIVVTLDERQVFRVINLNDSKATETCAMMSVEQLQAETIYQRLSRDSGKGSKSIKTYANTIVNCSFNPKYKEIFLIAKNSIYRGRLDKWTDYVSSLLLEERNWERALKLCLELHKGNYNIFAEPFTPSKGSKALLCDIGRIYLKQKMKELQSGNLEQFSIKYVRDDAQALFDTIIEYFSLIRCEEFLFCTIFPLITEKYFYEFGELLYDCLEPAIANDSIKSIPSRDVFTKLVSKYQSKPALINQLVINLEEQSLFYEEIIDVCESQKLFEALCYMCAVNGDFISPLNKIMSHLLPDQQAQPLKDDAAVKLTLRDYLEKLLAMKYPNGKPIHVDKRVPMLQTLSAWISCDEAIKFLSECFGLPFYFATLSSLKDNLFKYAQPDSVSIICEQLLSPKNKVFFQEHKQLFNLTELLTAIGLNKAFHYSNDQVKQILPIIKEYYEQGQRQCDNLLILRFLEKYLIQSQIQGVNLEETVFAGRDNEAVQEIRIGYSMLKEEPLEVVETVYKASKTRKVSEAFLLYVLDNISEKPEQSYLDVLLKWNPAATLLHVIRSNLKGGIQAINERLSPKVLPDERERYMIVRKLLKVLRRENKESMSLEAGILINYIDSLCKFKNEKRVFAEITQNKDEYMRITNELVEVMQRHHFQSCLAYLYDLQLRSHEAFDAYSTVYAAYFRKNFARLMAHEHCHGRFMTKIFNLMLQLCIRINQQEQWGRLIGGVFRPLEAVESVGGVKAPAIDTIQKISQIKAMQEHPFMLELKQTLEMTIGTMGREVSISFMAGELNKYAKLLNKTFIVNCFASTLHDCHRRVDTVAISRNLMVEQFVKEFDSYFKQHKVKGVSYLEICQRCNKELTHSTPTRTYSCGHAYHSYCDQGECKKCAKEYYGDHDHVDPFVDPNSILHESMIQEGDGSLKEEADSDTKNMYKCLAFDDFIRRREATFKQFRETYDAHIEQYKREWP